MMSSNLRVNNYRGFADFTLKDPARINLLVGKNNSGKTAILEAIRLLATRADSDVLIDIAQRRGEFHPGHGPDYESGGFDISHFFHGHRVADGITASISGLDLPAVKLSLLSSNVEQAIEEELFDPEGPAHRAVYAVGVSSGDSPEPVPRFFVTEDGALAMNPVMRRRLIAGRRAAETPPAIFIPSDARPSSSLRLMWNDVLRNKAESGVIAALKILEPNVEDVAFETAESSRYRTSSRTGVLVGFRNEPRRIPIGSMGDGMSRLLGMSISLVQAKGGYLLVDEIDTGLHYSVMLDLWRLVADAAIKFDLRVFATTHSYDCVEGLASLCRTDQNILQSVAIHKISPKLPESVAFRGKDITGIAQHNIEVR